MTESPHPSTSVLHKQWVELENEHHELTVEIDSARARGADLEPMREGQMRLLLQINALVYEIRDAPATTTEDFLALLDVAIEHELDLAPDIAFYGPADYPIILNPAVSFGSPAGFCGSSQPWREFRPEQGAAAGRVDGPSDSA